MFSKPETCNDQLFSPSLYNVLSSLSHPAFCCCLFLARQALTTPDLSPRPSVVQGRIVNGGRVRRSF